MKPNPKIHLRGSSIKLFKIDILIKSNNFQVNVSSFLVFKNS